MATVQYCAQPDLEQAVGGAANLTQLLDKAVTGGADANFVAGVLNYASGEVASAIQLAVDLTQLVAPYPAVLIQRTAQIAAYHAFNRGTGGRGIPANIIADYKDALRWLDDVGAGKRTLGVSPHPGTTLQLVQVDTDPALNRINRTSLKGFI